MVALQERELLALCLGGLGYPEARRFQSWDWGCRRLPSRACASFSLEQGLGSLVYSLEQLRGRGLEDAPFYRRGTLSTLLGNDVQGEGSRLSFPSLLPHRNPFCCVFVSCTGSPSLLSPPPPPEHTFFPPDSEGFGQNLEICMSIPPSHRIKLMSGVGVTVTSYPKLPSEVCQKARARLCILAPLLAGDVTITYPPQVCCAFSRWC